MTTENHAITGHCVWPGCDSTNIFARDEYTRDDGAGEVPLCFHHGTRIWTIFEQDLNDQEKMAALEDDKKILTWWKQREQRRIKERRKKISQQEERKKLGGDIYYLQLDGHIKIGWSSNLAERIKSYPPGGKLLTSHPGTLGMEEHLHNRFKVHKSKGREWYKPNPELNDHIEQIKRINTLYHSFYRDYTTVDPKLPGAPCNDPSNDHLNIPRLQPRNP